MVQLGKPGAAETCDELLDSVPSSVAPRALGRWALRRGDAPGARSYFSLACSRFVESGQNHYWLGVANALEGRAHAARAAWLEAVRVWPDYTPAWKALEQPPANVEAAEREELAFERRLHARTNASCGRVYHELGLAELATRSFQTSDRADPGFGELSRTVTTSRSPMEWLGLEGASKEARAHPLALVLEAERQIALRQARDAWPFLLRATQLDPGAPEVNEAIVRACALEPAHELCQQRREERLFAPRDRSELLEADVYQIDSRFLGYAPPRLTEVVLQPLAEADAFHEVDGVVGILQRRFPNVRFTQRPLAKLPPEAVDPQRAQVVDELLFSAMPPTRGTVMIVDRDLTEYGLGYLFGTTEFETVRGIVSVARFRTPAGRPAIPTTVLTGTALLEARERLANQLTSTLGKLLGMSFPCPQARCVLRYPRSRQEFDAKGGEFCPAHQEELRRLVQ